MLAGLSASQDSAFMTVMREQWEERENMLRELARRTGREYQKPTRSITIDEYMREQ